MDSLDDDFAKEIKIKLKTKEYFFIGYTIGLNYDMSYNLSIYVNTSKFKIKRHFITFHFNGHGEKFSMSERDKERWTELKRQRA